MPEGSVGIKTARRIQRPGAESLLASRGAASFPALRGVRLDGGSPSVISCFRNPEGSRSSPSQARVEVNPQTEASPEVEGIGVKRNVPRVTRSGFLDTENDRRLLSFVDR